MADLVAKVVPIELLEKCISILEGHTRPLFSSTRPDFMLRICYIESRCPKGVEYDPLLPQNSFTSCLFRALCIALRSSARTLSSNLINPKLQTLFNIVTI